MSVNPGMFSSKTDDWATPQDFFDRLNAVFSFDLDVCASADNAKCERFFDADADGLQQEWVGACWMNPPYGRGIGAWVSKAKESARRNGATVVCLLPARTDTRWGQENCRDAEVFFVPGRLKFGKATSSAPFPCAVVTFRPSAVAALSKERNAEPATQQELHP